MADDDRSVPDAAQAAAPGPTLRFEQSSHPAGATVLCCRGEGGAAVELAMTPDALTGFLSWLESAPPGSAIPWAS